MAIISKELVKKKPVVSFCIPTYNRSNKVFTLVSEILSYSEMDIEVVVLDNCSTDDTIEKLSTIKDKRFSLYKNEVNIGGKNNCLKVLTYGIGDYLCVCLDKDSINHVYINDFISFLKTNPCIVLGYCTLNIEKVSKFTIYEKGINSIYNMAYLSKHPSGNFYRNDFLTKLSIYDNRDVYYSGTGFMFEFINAEMSLLGKSANINIPLIATEAKKDASESTSHSYSGNDIFFLPEKQYELFNYYVKHISIVEISKVDKKKLIEKIFNLKLESATIGFDALCKDKLICNHYGYKPKKTGIMEILSNDLFFCRKFAFTCDYKTFMLRILICIKANIRIMIKVSKLKQLVKLIYKKFY